MFLFIESYLLIETTRLPAMNKLKEIAGVLAASGDEELIEGFLKSILTKNESEEISSRWELVKLLDDGLSQRKIAEKLGISLCKITRGSRELRKSRSPFKAMIETHRKIQKSRNA
jgi:TrpR family trp operon transcriptional repressor